MSIKDYINIVLILFDINSFIGGIQQYATKEVSKIFGLIEIGVYESIIIFLSITALLFIYNKGWTEKHLDELTGRAKRKREHLERLEEIDRESKERLELDARNRIEKQKKEAKEEQAKIEEENKKRQELEEKERKEKEKLDELLSLIRENSKLLVSKIENKGKFTPLPNILHQEKTSIRLNIRLRGLGFTMPSEEEMADENFDVWWCIFLSLLEVAIEEGDYKKELNLWKVFMPMERLKKLSKNP